MSHHRCYGLVLHSELDLPELPEVPESPADVRIRIAALGPPPLGAELLPRGLWRDGSRCGVAIAGVARFEARAGQEIVVDPAPGAEPAQVRLFLLGTLLGALMMQRDHLVLHGNAVQIGTACAVVVGHSGAGKSTLAAEFARRGLTVLSDDVVPIDADGRALPGRPRIHLWRDALERLGVGTGTLERVHREHEKFVLPLEGATTPLPLRWVYALERHPEHALEIVPVRGASTYSLLHEHTYRNEFVHGPDAVARHLQQCSRVAANARISRVRRPDATMTAAATADAVLADIADHLAQQPMEYA